MHREFPWWWSSSLRWWYSTVEIEVDLAPPLRERERAPTVVKMLCVGDVFWEKIRMRRDVCLRWKYECTYIVERGRWEASAGGVISRRPAVPEAFGNDLWSNAIMSIDFKASSRRNWRGKWTVRLNGPLVPVRVTSQDQRPLSISPGCWRKLGLKGTFELGLMLPGPHFRKNRD
jgi:hypothetical protein